MKLKSGQRYKIWKWEFKLYKYGEGAWGGWKFYIMGYGIYLTEDELLCFLKLTGAKKIKTGAKR